jgi:glycosyltransferase involved in cell wall biosynthesis
MLGSVRQEAAPLQEEVADAARRGEVDVLLGCFASGLLYKLTVDRPVVHFSDLTFHLLEETYSWARERPRWRRAASDAVERDVLRHAAAIIVPTGWVRDSVVQHYGVPAQHVHVIPLGANLCDGADAKPAGPDPSPPGRDDLRLTITAADPKRKRLDLAVEVVEVLRRRGWRATLTCVGGCTPKAEAAPFVECVGRLDHNDPQERRRHIQLIRDSHIMMLPSDAEAFGIAPVEAAHLGRPSVVSAAGGLPEVVLDGRTGRVVPVDGTAEQYADAVEQLVADPQTWRDYCAAAEDRAREVLNWTHFTTATMAVLEDVCRRPRPRLSGPPAAR